MPAKHISGVSSPRCRPCLCTDVAEAYWDTSSVRARTTNGISQANRARLRPRSAPAPIADLAVKSGSKLTSTNGYRLFASSDHPSRPQTVDGSQFRSIGRKSPSTPPAALPRVQFGSAPDRVLTTMPRRTRCRTTKPRSVGRSVAGKPSVIRPYFSAAYLNIYP